MSLISRDDKPTLNQLLCVSFTDDEGINRSFRLMDRLRPYWMSFAVALRFPHYAVRTLEKEKDPIFCLLGEWLRGANQEHDESPLAWTTFVRALRDANLREEVHILENFILYPLESITQTDAGLHGKPSGRRRYYSADDTPPHSQSNTPFGSRPGTPGSRPGTPGSRPGSSQRYRSPSTPHVSRPSTSQSRSGSATRHDNTTPTMRPKSRSVPEVIVHPVRNRRKSSGGTRYSKHRKDEHRSGAKSAPLGDRPPPSQPRPRSHYDDRRGSCAEIQVDAKVVEELRDLQTHFSNMLTDIRKLGKKCDLEEVKFFLNDLLETNDFQQCTSFDDVLRTLHVEKHVSTFNVYYLEQLADRCKEAEMKLSIEKFNEKRKQFLDIKSVNDFHTSIMNLQADQTLKDLTITIPRQLSNKRVIKGIEELAELVFIQPLNLTVKDGTNYSLLTL